MREHKDCYSHCLIPGNESVFGWFYCFRNCCLLSWDCEVSDVIAEGLSTKETPYMSSLKQSLLERLKLRSLLARLLSPMLWCLMTGTKNKPSAMQTSGKKGPKMKQVQISTNSHANKEKDVKKASTMMSATNQSIGDQRLIQGSSHGQFQARLMDVPCETNVLQLETSLPITPSMSNSPRCTSTQGLHLNSKIWSGSPSCWVSPSTSMQSSVDGT